MATVMKLTPVGMSADRERWEYLVAFDLDAHGGRGYVETSTDINHAMRFKDTQTAMQVWRTPSKVTPFRPDGKPNRPLTAYHATFEIVTDGDGNGR